MGELAARVLIVEDHDMLAQALAMAIRLEGVADVCTTAGPLDLASVMAQARDVAPDAVLLDIDLGEAGSGISLVGPLVELGAVVVLLTGIRDRRAIAEGIEAGAVGVIEKSVPLDEVMRLLGDVIAGRSIITPAQRSLLLLDLAESRALERATARLFGLLTKGESQVLGFLVEGLSPEAIAEKRLVSLSTVRSQVKAVLRKLDVHSTLAAVALARRNGWPTA